MFSAAELIDALRKRGRRSLRPDVPPGEFPPGWAQWFEAMAQRVGRITGATADAIISVFLQRELAMPPRSAVALNRWQAFATLWRQQWQPPEREDRRVRIAALVITFFVHVVLLVVLLWLAYVRFTAMPPAAGEEVVQVEFVGQGTPQDQGGGPPSAQNAPQPAMATHVPTPTQSAPAATTATPAVKPQPPSPAPSPPTPPVPAPPSQAPEAAPAPPVRQPLQVTEKSTPGATFVLPPPTPHEVELPRVQLAAPELQAPTREVVLVPALPAVRPLEPQLPQVSVTAPQLQVQPRPVVVQAQPEVSKPVVEPPAPSPTAPVPPQTPAPAAATAATSPATSPSSRPTPAPARPATAEAAPAGQSSAASTSASPSSGAQPAAPAAGRGPAATTKPGAWPTPRLGDDWGASTRNRPGGNPGSKPGLLNPDGTPRLAPGSAAAAGGGFPPGSDHWTRDQIDRAGTWLKRPPNDYTPTRFDQYWLPSSTLLEEWVRRGVREVAIPIPGTTKKISCTISILQLGGGCTVTDPNLNDQEAIARPPPDVPFKPDLQEDQDSLRKPAPNP